MFRSIVASGLRTTKVAAPFGVRSRSTFASTTLIGRLGQDLEPQESSSGKKYLRYSLAVQKTLKDAPANWFNVIVFNEQQVEFLTTYAKKGALLHIEATPDAQVFETEDGSKQSRVSFIQKQVNILHQKEDEQ